MSDENKKEEGSKEEKIISGKFPLRESYSPEKDTLDTSKPPQASGVPPKDSGDKETGNKE